MEHFLFTTNFLILYYFTENEKKIDVGIKSKTNPDLAEDLDKGLSTIVVEQIILLKTLLIAGRKEQLYCIARIKEKKIRKRKRTNIKITNKTGVIFYL